MSEELDVIETDGKDGDNLPATVSAEGALPIEYGGGAPLDGKDFMPPKLNLVQRNSDALSEFPQGTWVLNREVALTKEVGEPLSIVVVGNPIKFYQEKRPYDPNQLTPPQTFRSEQEVKEAGLTLDWDNTKDPAVPPTASRAARVLVYILKPDALDESAFGLSVEGLGSGTIASWFLVNTSYRSVARRLFTAQKIDLAGKPLASMVWTLTSRLQKIGGFPVYVPSVTPCKRLDDETVGRLLALFQG